jgi:urease beta subunit
MSRKLLASLHGSMKRQRRNTSIYRVLGCIRFEQGEVTDVDLVDYHGN